MTDGNISLTDIKLTHLHDFYTYRSDEELLRYQNFKLNSLDEAREFIIKQSSLKLGGTDEWKQLAIVNNENEILGDCAFKPYTHEPRIAEIGITVRREHHKKGVASSALSLLIKHAFTELNIHKIVAEVDIRNKASQKLMEKTGFSLEGKFEKHFWDEMDQKWFDELHYGLINSHSF